jgi:hypothetical protein
MLSSSQLMLTKITSSLLKEYFQFRSSRYHQANSFMHLSSNQPKDNTRTINMPESSSKTTDKLLGLKPSFKLDSILISNLSKMSCPCLIQRSQAIKECVGLNLSPTIPKEPRPSVMLMLYSWPQA